MFRFEDAPVVARHLADLRLAGYSEATIYCRSRILQRLTFAIGPLITATPDGLRLWRAALTVSNPTIVAYVSHVREFYRWCTQHGYRDGNPAAGLPVPRLPRRVPRPISNDDLAFVIATADDRVRLWLVLAGWCGLRAKEIALLTWEAVIDTADPPVLIVTAESTKGGRRERTVPLHPFALTELQAQRGRRAGYVSKRRDGRGGPNAPHRVSQMANAHIHACGSAATLHQLRHWFGTQTYAAQRDLRVVQELLGHSSPVTTAGYAAMSSAAASAAVSALPVPSTLRPVRPAAGT